MAWSPDGRSRSLRLRLTDTVRIWDVESGNASASSKGTPASVDSVAWSGDVVFSGASNGVMRVWEHARACFAARRSETAPMTPDACSPEQLQYTNAKVLLVGDSGVGKTGLANYLALGLKDEGHNMSTDGAWATHWPLPHAAQQDGVEREIWLWDFAGPGRLPPRPPAFHGRTGRGRAGVQPAERKSL